MKINARYIYSLCAFTALFMMASCTQDMRELDGFTEQTITISDYGLFDMGVTDINHDGLLDVYTSNYSAKQSVALNNGSGFTDVYSTWKMDQDRQFPGLAVCPEEPNVDEPGIYINWVGPDVVVRFHQMKSGPIKGTIEVLTSCRVMTREHVVVDVAEKEIAPEVPRSLLSFTGEAEGLFTFRPYNHALPFRFSFDDTASAEMIHVGYQRISPVSRTFSFQLRDRHGMAWADVNNDDRMDLFITRGGEKDTMGKMPISFWDELLVGTRDCMEDTGMAVGLDKKGCPGRQAAWVDYNGDNLLDIYVVCGRGENPHPNMLFQQTRDGRFEDVADEVGLDMGTNGSFVWLDADRDGDMDLFWSDSNGFFLFKNEEGNFLPTQIKVPDKTIKSNKLTVSDYDCDSDLDVFSASTSGNVLFVSMKGSFSAVSPLSVGLPRNSYTANWVDYDNDGMMELHAIPDGLYFQNREGRFAAASRLKNTLHGFYPYRLAEARESWFDVDNNGTRDLLVSTAWTDRKSRLFNLVFRVTGRNKRFGGLDRLWETRLLVNNNTENHWLQVELIGPPGNRQAIGAGITLSTVNGERFQQVGNADGAHYSQGHYRLYFGLGLESQTMSLRVDWPDGTSREIARPPADQLLEINWQEK